MKEVEVKILEIDKDQVIKKLESLRAKKVLDEEMFSVYYDIDYRGDFERTMRIRKKNGKNILTFKRREKESKVRTSEEIEVVVDNFENMRRILKYLEVKERDASKTHRISYKIKNSLVEIDEKVGIPTYLEIESPDEDELKEVVELLGYEIENTSNWSGKQLAEYYSKS